MPRGDPAVGRLDYDRPVPSDPIPFSRVVALVPVRGLERAKLRLGGALDAEERRGLVERLLGQTVAAASALTGVRAVAVVSADPATLAVAAGLGASPVADSGGGLNEALEAGRAWAIAERADALLVLPGDLPAVTTAELGRVFDAAREAARTAAAGSFAAGGQRGVVALVPDRVGRGTNVLLLAPPDCIPFRFGEDSRRAHAALAATAGATYVEVDGPLTLDLDTPDDLLAAEAAGLGAALGGALP